MLSLLQQRLLVFMIKKRITIDTQGIYTSITFYKSVNYLIRKKIVKHELFHDDKRKKIYSLTQKGEILAMMLAQFSEIEGGR